MTHSTFQFANSAASKQPSQIKQLVRSDHLLGHCSTGVLPRKYDIANSGSVAVDAYEAEAEGDLGHPRAPSLNQEVSKDQAEDSEQGEDGPVLGAGKTQKQTCDNALPGDSLRLFTHTIYKTKQGKF